MNYRITTSLVIAVLVVTANARAQTPPPVRPLGPIERVSTEPLMSAATARALPNGRVFVNDITAHRVLLFDSTLATARVIADSTDATSNLYGARPGALLRYRGDTTLFVDVASLSMLVLDPAGKIARVMAVPRPNDAIYLLGNVYGTPGFDAQGRLVYRGVTNPKSHPWVDGQRQLPPEWPDSAPIVRVDLSTRILDTVASFKIPPVSMSPRWGDNGRINGIQFNGNLPFQPVDDWAVLPDGSVAVVRGRDFHVDWVNGDGSRTSSPRMPFDWEHLDDDTKATLMDSINTTEQARTDSIMKVARERASASGPIVMGGSALGGGVASGRGAGGGGGDAVPLPRQPPPVIAPSQLYTKPSELPDYRPPFAPGAMRPDADGNLWICTTTMSKGQPVYDIVNRKGVLVDRVLLPPFRYIAGFGPGVVYLAVRDSAGVVHLERARVK